MSKALAIVGIVCSVFAALVAAVLQDAALFVIVVVTATGAVFLFLQRNLQATIAGVLALVLGVLGVLGAVGSVTTEGGGGASFGVSEAMGRALAIVALLVVPTAATMLRRDDLPPWATWVAYGTALLTAVVAVASAGSLGDQTSTSTLAVAVLALGPIVAMAFLLRSGGDGAPAGAPAAPSSSQPRPPGRRP